MNEDLIYKKATSMKMRELPHEWKKINLGCGQKILTGWINTDIYPFEGVDRISDLNEPWPWDDNSIHYIRAFDVVEHLRDPIHTMNEAWRVLAHGGIFEVWVPSTDGRGAFQDPTHISFWNHNSFAYYSKAHFAGMYPHLIRCDFELRVFDTGRKPDGSVWTWALCRAIKDVSSAPAVPDSWYDALSVADEIKRLVPGYQGNSLGTIPMEG